MEHLLRHAGIEAREMVMWITALCDYRKCGSMGEPVATPRILGTTILGTPAQKAFLENSATPVNANTIAYATLVGQGSATALQGVPGISTFATGTIFIGSFTMK